MDSLDRHEDYGKEALDETDLLVDPIEQFKIWLVDAEAEKIYEPNAFVLGTINEQSKENSLPQSPAPRSSHTIQMISMSATVGNLRELSVFLESELYTDSWRPVQLHEHIKVNFKK